MTDDDAKARIDALHSAFPREGLFSEKTWRWSPKPFPLPRSTVKQLERLGPLLRRFQATCNTFYQRSLKGTLPSWISEYVDTGKPEWLLEMSRDSAIRDDLPQVIRPDLLLTEDGLAMTEIDNVPGGIGVTAWLNEVYSQWDPNNRLIGGKTGMLAGFRRILIKGGDLLISDESDDYRPEMTWLARRLNEVFFHEGTIWRALKADDFPAAHYRAVYRFFELFDLDNIVGARHLGQQVNEGIAKVTPPYKPYLEEKLWLALFHSHLLRPYWIRELRASNEQFLRTIIPESWVVDPSPLPHHAVLPGLNINHWDELADFTQSERQLVLKISGYSELAWGSRGVHIGQDMSQQEWTDALDNAVESFDHHPYIIQRFHKGKRVVHPYWDHESGKIEQMEGRVRLCPYYLPDDEGNTTLHGVLATIVPAEKKLIHGMSEAILVPCVIADD
jgi:hypothetical protein